MEDGKTFFMCEEGLLEVIREHVENLLMDQELLPSQTSMAEL